MKIKSQSTEIFLIITLFILMLGYAVLAGAQIDDGLTPLDNGLEPLGEGMNPEDKSDFVDASNQNVDMITKQLSDLEAISFDEKVAKELFGREDYQSLIKFDYGINPPDLGRDNPFLPVTK